MNMLFKWWKCSALHTFVEQQLKICKPNVCSDYKTIDWTLSLDTHILFLVYISIRKSTCLICLPKTSLFLYLSFILPLFLLVFIGQTFLLSPIVTTYVYVFIFSPLKKVSLWYDITDFKWFKTITHILIT